MINFISTVLAVGVYLMMTLGPDDAVTGKHLLSALGAATFAYGWCCAVDWIAGGRIAK